MRRAGDKGPAARHRQGTWERLVHNGLRAQLKTGNLISGACMSIWFYPDDESREIVWGQGSIPELPTVPTPLDELRGLLTCLARLPLDPDG